MNFRQFYIDGAWVDPVEPRTHEVVNPANGQAFEQISLGSAKDVDRAVAAARAAFPAWARSSREERIAIFEKIIEGLKARRAEIADAISREMGAPAKLALNAQAPAAYVHFLEFLKVLREFPFERAVRGKLVTLEPTGVCALITPWNWPVNQIACKVAPALAAGCTMVLKPSEVAPLNAHIFAQVLHEAGVPKGVFNLVDGEGPVVGEALCSHPGVDMVSLTGSTRAGIAVMKRAAEQVKRVALELGGKSPNLILEDADLQSAVSQGVTAMMGNSGQSCNAPTRMLVPASRHDEALAIAKAAAEAIVVGDPAQKGVQMGPVASRAQFEKVQGLIRKGINEGATLVTGGLGQPEGLEQGWYVRPTVFGHVRNDMSIAREEIFGPVLCIIPYQDEADAVRIANDTPYGLAAYVQSGELEHARRVGAQIRAGNVHCNTYQLDIALPFGGFKQSGIGREWGEEGLLEFLETKAYVGYAVA